LNYYKRFSKFDFDVIDTKKDNRKIVGEKKRAIVIGGYIFKKNGKNVIIYRGENRNREIEESIRNLFESNVNISAKDMFFSDNTNLSSLVYLRAFEYSVDIKKLNYISYNKIEEIVLQELLDGKINLRFYFLFFIFIFYFLFIFYFIFLKIFYLFILFFIFYFYYFIIY
jgi:hypothetical protein